MIGIYGVEVKIKLFQDMVMYHIKLCGTEIEMFSLKGLVSVLDKGIHYMGVANKQVPSNMCIMHRYRLSCTWAPFIHSLVSNDLLEDIKGPNQTSDFMDVKADIGRRCSHMPEDTFLLGIDHM